MLFKVLLISMPAFAFCLSRRSLRLAQIEAAIYMKPTLTISIKKSEPFIVRIFLQITYFCTSLFKISKYRLFRVKLALVSDRDQVHSRCLVYQERK